MCTCLHVHMRGGVCADSPPPYSRPPGPGRGQQRRRPLQQGDPPPSLPRPHPLPAGRFADRPNRQKLRTRGLLGAFLLWCEFPMAGAGAGAGTPSAALPARPPGPQPREGGKETRGRPPRAPPAPVQPRPRALWPMAGLGAGSDKGGAWPASRRLRPSRDLGDLLSCPALSALGKTGWSRWSRLMACSSGREAASLRPAVELVELGVGLQTGGVWSPAAAVAHQLPPCQCRVPLCVFPTSLPVCTNVWNFL